MNRRNFIKLAGAALASLALNIRFKLGLPIKVGIGRASPMMIDNSGIKLPPLRPFWPMDDNSNLLT